jgi:Protein of unknown function (DUF4241)
LRPLSFQKMATDINRYLGSALESNSDFLGVTVVRHYIGDLLLPTGQLMMCDPFMVSLCKPFKTWLPCGKFPVFLSVADNAGDFRNTFATIRLNTNPVVGWSVMELDGDASFWPDGMRDDRIAIDNAVGCFFDYAVAPLIAPKMEEFRGSLTAFDAALMSSDHGSLIMNFENANLIAFISGYGDGLYGTYSALDKNGEVCALVTDLVATP